MKRVPQREFDARFAAAGEHFVGVGRVHGGCLSARACSLRASMAVLGWFGCERQGKCRGKLSLKTLPGKKKENNYPNIHTHNLYSSLSFFFKKKRRGVSPPWVCKIRFSYVTIMYHLWTTT